MELKFEMVGMPEVACSCTRSREKWLVQTMREFIVREYSIDAFCVRVGDPAMPSPDPLLSKLSPKIIGV